MKLSYAASAFLAPAIVRAAAFAMPEPTQHFAVAADNWSPAPTLAPQFNIFGRDALQANDGNTCGYVSGLSGTYFQPRKAIPEPPLTALASSITCGVSSLCATNTFYGVHSCCPGPTDNLGSCTIPTTCIAATAMSSLCTDDTCSSNNAIAKCTASTAAECYKYLLVYDTTTMTQHGCTATGTTLTIPRSYGASTSVKVVTVTETPSPATTPTASSSPGTGSGAEKKQSLGPIVGGTIGACTIISIVALTAFLIHRRRVKARSSNAPPPPPVSQFSHNTPQFDPRGFPANTTGWTEQDIKTWQQSGGVWRPGMSANGMGMGMGMVGVSEVHGEDRAVEVEAREKIKQGHWQVPGVGAVEVEAPLKREREREREEKKWSWRGPVEAPS